MSNIRPQATPTSSLLLTSSRGLRATNLINLSVHVQVSIYGSYIDTSLPFNLCGRLFFVMGKMHVYECHRLWRTYFWRFSRGYTLDGCDSLIVASKSKATSAFSFAGRSLCKTKEYRNIHASIRDCSFVSCYLKTILKAWICTSMLPRRAKKPDCLWCSQYIWCTASLN